MRFLAKAEIPPQLRDLVLAGPKEGMKDYSVDIKMQYNAKTQKAEIIGWNLLKKDGDAWKRVDWNEILR